MWEEDADEFRPERWLEQPDSPMYMYELGYRMCAGCTLANREFYLLFIRLIHCFKIEKFDPVDCHPVRRNMDPTILVAMLHRTEPGLCQGMRLFCGRLLRIEEFAPVE